MNNNENHQSNQAAVETLANFFNAYKWRIIGFFLFLILAILFITLGFWKTILIAFLCLVGIGLGYIKDRTQDFLNFINRLS
ncbi:DUF2273 domain-containing protein [Staphylococcus hominis]|uniref:DUF2273 domain-containing protein n=1 Tax=Staphylococcus hominis TaxID=1290 RepID=UPI0011892960|nr:DUF2273 domain-containing protein [Staphylococcus hominis]QDW82859.1 DUF2273 domain-containing protein [Staphylococcus chromogenes]QDW87862.1 DUF2273 domain-containing protein [Staphylococcus hominis]